MEFFVVGGLIFASPFCKNYIMVRNPLFPQFFEFLEVEIGQKVCKMQLRFFADYKKAGDNSLFGFLTSPWYLTMSGKNI